MDIARFDDNAPGRLAPTTSGAIAFVPDPLPPVLDWEDRLVSVVAKAGTALGRLAEVGRLMPNPHLLIRPFMRREAVLSSQIEGTHASYDELLLFELDEDIEQRVPDVREVANYVHALEYGLQRADQLPLSQRLLREMHRILMNDVRGGDQTPGEFRRNQVHIGPKGAGIEHARFVPPPPGEHLTQAMDDFERYLHEDSQMPAVVRLALIHYQFEAIHPFNDGNGRIGRLLVTLSLCLENLLPQPLLYLSAYFEQHRQTYYDLLLDVSRRGAWNQWVEFFARGVAQQAEDAADRAVRLRTLQQQYAEQVRSPRTSALLLQLIEHLFAQPAITTTTVRDLLKVTPRTAQQHIDRLRKAEILKEVTGQKRNRIYIAPDIIRAIHDEPNREQ